MDNEELMGLTLDELTEESNYSLEATNMVFALSLLAFTGVETKGSDIVGDVYKACNLT